MAEKQEQGGVDEKSNSGGIEGSTRTEAKAHDDQGEEGGSNAECLNADEDDGTTSEGNSEEENDEATVEDAKRLHEEGQAEHSRGNYEEAAAKFAKALKIRTREEGDLSIGCAPTFMMNGVALFRKAQEENQAFGSEVQKHMEKKEQGSQQAPPSEQANPPDSTVKGKQKVEEGDGDASKQQESAHEAEGEDTEPTEMGLAWELLETARRIYEREGGHELDLAEVREYLGQLSLEDGKFDSAAEELQAALDLYSRNVESDDRRLAEVLYWMAIAFQFNERPAEALEHCQNAHRVCERRLDNFRKKEELSDDEEREKSDLDGILKELQAKVEELESDAKQYEQTKKEISKLFSNMFGCSMEEAQGASTHSIGFSQQGAQAGQSNSRAHDDSAPTDLGVVGKSAGKRKIIPQPTGGGNDQEAERSAKARHVATSQNDHTKAEEANDHETDAGTPPAPPQDTQEKPPECNQQ